MKQTGKALACMICILMISGCTGYDKDTVADNQVYHITANGKTAFASEYQWDISEEPLEIVIPEKAAGAAVKKLGGFFGTGVPAPFCILGETGYSFSAYDPCTEKYGSPLILKEVPVTVYLPKTLEEIVQVKDTGWYGRRNKNGELVFLRPVIRFECDPENPTYYTENGQIYKREDGSQIDLSEVTSPEMPEMTLAEKLRGRYVKENENDREVWDLFDSMGMLFGHINWYMEDSEYMYSAIEYTPVDAAVLASTEADSIDVSAKQFSSFTMAGQYTELDHPYYRLTAASDRIIITALDENREPVMNSGFEMERDMTQPSQFPLEEALFDTLLKEEETAMIPGFTMGRAGLKDHILECEDYRIEFYDDGMVTMDAHREETPLYYHGYVKEIPAKEMYGDTDLLFSMRAIGGTAEPIIGRVTLHKEEDGSFRFIPVEGYSCEPLVTQGQESTVIR